MKIHTTQEP